MLRKMSFNYLKPQVRIWRKRTLVDLPRKAQTTILSPYLWQTITLKADHSFSISVLYNGKTANQLSYVWCFLTWEEKKNECIWLCTHYVSVILERVINQIVNKTIVLPIMNEWRIIYLKKEKKKLSFVLWPYQIQWNHV